MEDQEFHFQQNEPIDLAFLRSWIGREQEAEDVLTPRIVDGLRATLDGAMSSTAIPASVHWCLAPALARQSDLSRDGHPNRGDFLPPVPVARRMWAGSDVEFFSDLALMDMVTRRSRIEDVEVKQGRTGTLVFVTVLHDWSTVRGPTLRELQKIVYRSPSATPTSRPAPVEKAQATRQQAVEASEVLLFRYSALTFNAHRIHYDRPYATAVEGYGGLLVHGPLQASLLLEYARTLRDGERPHRFSFKGVEPLLSGQTFTLNAKENRQSVDLWCENAQGGVTMTATAKWA
ncbi:MaoC family dehydratase N-terminal domain-containing protein [Ensifer adhaerens]|uniref:FAS1-like dehydratase domain-containing protein n=1 Tax=Ensifer adhaerens TaxID=106592 RepID=UPI001CBDCA95|nr:MaoC family dehydratase N-terminal domain-containing protein [Ensifer adhaerens]MBZ7924344.1 MaoC family dehydratase N-terminal domain-containing protein [Ensifer adhaerens]UAX96407.1 MaoC family dehydratase N-terminal domain-containing protein [Ensifer adhaerens]UAY04250.1 MaoC family dehydratase N-terminal domain-containing protein [Ensifer adhaerens]UAY12236.1 MaoC family dehydratase N-terminal domain-containing protein [Ensifer adhaerens]